MSDLTEAAALLKMSAETLRQRAASGVIQAYKPGKRWVFLESDLHDYLIAGYDRKQAVVTRRMQCPSTSAGKSGGYALHPPVDSEYTNLLKLPTDRPPRNTTTR